MEFINYMRDVFSFNHVRDEGKLLSAMPIERSEDYNIDYIKWLMTNKYQSMLEDIYRAFHNLHKSVDRRDPYITFLMIPNIHGFTVHEENCRWTQNDMRFLFEYLSHLLEEEFGYEQEVVVIEKHEYQDRQESVERYRLGTLEEVVDYSSILLRLCYTNDRITSLKFSAIRTQRRIANFPHLLQNLAEA